MILLIPMIHKKLDFLTNQPQGTSKNLNKTDKQHNYLCRKPLIYNHFLK